MSTHAWLNWRSQQDGHPRSEGWESPLYGDTSLNGILSLGPYRVMPAMTRRGMGSAIQAVLRVDFHPWPDFVDTFAKVRLKTDEKTYHGGTLDDEITSLICLATGARLRSGGRNRMWFREGEDPLGTPIEFDHSAPQLNVRPSRTRLLPNVGDDHSLAGAGDLLEVFSKISRSRSVVALVRAARMYSQALWVADDDANLAWILLVGALEAAAVEYSGDRSMSPENKLELAEPALVAMLKRHGGEQLVSDYARERASFHRLKRRFISLLIDKCPAPPAPRAADWGVIEWERMAELVGTIYDYRSRALHAGHPFPYPMFEPPHRDADHDAWYELPPGLSTTAQGSTWNADDIPMLFWVFEYIARRVLCEWWRGLT